MKPAYLGSCSEIGYCGLQIIPWLIKPQTTKCLKNEAEHFSALWCEVWVNCIERTQPDCPREQAQLGTPTQLARFLGKSAVSCLLAFSDSKSNFYGFWISSWDINGRGKKATMMLPRIKAVVGLETPQNSTHWRKLFWRHLNPLHFCIVSMENEITPILASKCFSSYFTPGPKICQGPAGHCAESGGWWPVRGRRKESRVEIGPK